MATIEEAVKLNLDNWTYEKELPEYVGKNRGAAEAFIPYISNGVVDLGCGDGAAEQYFLEAGIKYTGVDINQEKLNRVKSPTICIEMYAWLRKQPNDSIDNIFCHHTLEHTANPQQIIKQIYRTLKPKGACFIEVPSDPVHSVHVSYIHTWQELVPKEAELLVNETHPSDPIVFRVIWRKHG